MQDSPHTIQTVQPVQQLQQVHHGQPMPQVQHIQHVNHVQHVQQVQHGQAVQHGQHVQPVQHVQHGQPVQHAQHVQPVQYAQHVQPVQHVQHGQQVQHGQLQYLTQQPLITVMQPTPQPSDNYFRSGALKQMTVISLMQISMGTLCVIFGIVTTALTGSDDSEVSFPESIGYGIWIGPFFAVVGGFGMAAVKRNTSCWIIATMVLNIVCASLWCVLLIGFIAVALANDSNRFCPYYNYNDYDCIPSRRNAFFAWDCLMLIMGIIQFAITSWGACLCCGAICRCCKSLTGVNMYNNPSVPTYPYQVTQPTVAGPGYAIDRQQGQVGGLVTSPANYATVAPPMQGSTNPNYISQSSAIPSHSTAGTETQGFFPQTQSAEPEAKA